MYPESPIHACQESPWCRCRSSHQRPGPHKRAGLPGQVPAVSGKPFSIYQENPPEKWGKIARHPDDLPVFNGDVSVVVTLCLGRAIAESQVAMVARPAMELSDHVPDGRMMPDGY